MTFTGAVGAACMLPLRAIIAVCVALRIHPNMLTLIGVIINFGAAWQFARDRFAAAGFIMLAGNIFDEFSPDQTLEGNRFEHNIIVVTPTTLLATLRTIDNIWRYERQNENARIIADKAGSLYDKIRGFVEDFEKLGIQISTVHGTYESSMNKLTQGRGNLVRQANSFVELGVKVKKTFPRSILDQALGEETDEKPGRNRTESNRKPGS